MGQRWVGGAQGRAGHGGKRELQAQVAEPGSGDPGSRQEGFAGGGLLLGQAPCGAAVWVDPCHCFESSRLLGQALAS